MNEQNTNTETSQTMSDALKMIAAEDGRTLPTRTVECAAEMLKDIHHGQEWPIEFFAKRLGHAIGTVGLSLSISQLTIMLEREGFHLTSKGSNGALFKAEPLDRTAHTIRAFNRSALASLKRAAEYGSAVLQKFGHVMDESDRRQTEKHAELSALRYITARRLKPMSRRKSEQAEIHQ